MPQDKGGRCVKFTTNLYLMPLFRMHAFLSPRMLCPFVAWCVGTGQVHLLARLFVGGSDCSLFTSASKYKFYSGVHY